MFGLGQNLDVMRKSECTKVHEDSDFICLKMIEPMISKQNTNELLVIWPKKQHFLSNEIFRLFMFSQK